MANSPRSRDHNYKWRKRHGRMALPGFHVADVSCPQKLIDLGRLPAHLEDDRQAICEATIRFLDDVSVMERHFKR